MLYPAELRAQGTVRGLGALRCDTRGRLDAAERRKSNPRRRHSRHRCARGRSGGSGYIGRMVEFTTHKPTAACFMTGPHDVALCGLVAARRRRSAEMNEAIEQQRKEEQERAARRAKP